MQETHSAGVRVLLSIAGVALVTYVASVVIPVNSTTAGFAYLLFVLIVASAWGFVESAISSVLATLAFNFFFLPPVGTLTIADPQNWVALFSFLSTSLIASRLSAQAKRRTLDALDRQQDLERLYTFSRAILLIDSSEPFAKQLTHKLAETFQLQAVVLYDRRADEIYRDGPADFDGIEDQIREAALQGTSFSDLARNRVITAVRLGSEPIAGLGLEGALMQDPVLQGIANLVAIGLERARAQDLFHQVEAARQTERLRTTLTDAMAHEFKTPLTSIKAATTSLLSATDQAPESRQELLKIADEEADHLKELIDNAIDMARLDAAQIDIEREPVDLAGLVREVVASRQNAIDGRTVEIISDKPSAALFDRRLVRLAIQQLLDNALKYSPPGSPIKLQVDAIDGSARLEVIDQGAGIPVTEQARVFQRFYRSPSVLTRIPGSGLGLSIAHRIVQAHGGELTLTSQPGHTSFQMTLPAGRNGVTK